QEPLVVTLRLRGAPAEPPGGRPAERAHETREIRPRRGRHERAVDRAQGIEDRGPDQSAGFALEPREQIQKPRHGELPGAYRRPGVADDAEALALGEPGEHRKQ